MFEKKVDVDMHVEIKFKRNEIFGYMGKVFSDALDDFFTRGQAFSRFFFLCHAKK